MVYPCIPVQLEELIDRTAWSLNPAAQRMLDQLARAHNLKKLDDNLVDAQQALSNTAGEINDKLTENEAHAKKRRKAVEDGNDDHATEARDAEKRLHEMRDKVERMTQRMDEGMRKMIDGQHSLQSIKDSLAATAADARAHASTQASTQARSTQRRRTQATEGGDEEQDEEYQDFTPTDPNGGTQATKPVIDVFRTKLEDSKTRYQSHSYADRYVSNPSYVSFRRVVHDARHPDGDVQLPHQSEWFNEGQAPAPGVTTRGRRDENANDDSDDDLAVSKTTISTKCPLTLTEFQKPLTSRNCPHSFEGEAILSLINQSHQRENGRQGEKVVQCPVGGCSQILKRGDLHTDAVLIRQIKRIQRSRELENEGGDDGDGAIDGTTVIDDGDDAEDVDDIVEGRTQVKGEPRLGTNRPRPSPSTPPRPTQIVELGSDSEDDEAVEADGDETMEED